MFPFLNFNPNKVTLVGVVLGIVLVAIARAAFGF
jgi:hypothetical protein